MVTGRGWVLHTWNRTDLLKTSKAIFLQLNWPLFNGPLVRFSPSIATLQLLGGDSQRRRAAREFNALPIEHKKMALAGLRNKNVSISSPTPLLWGVSHRGRGRLTKNQRKKNVILQPKSNSNFFEKTSQKDTLTAKNSHVSSWTP